jgi:hypothetical protein
MANITITFSDGSTHLYEGVPESVTREQVMQRAAKDFQGKEIVDVSRLAFGEMSAGEVAARGVAALPGSVGKMVGDIASAIMSPVQTGKAVLDVAAGTLQNILPERLVQAIGEDPQSREAARRVASMYAQRYGTTEGLKEVIATDPAAFLADVSTLLTGGAAAAARAPAIAGGLSTAASFVDPLSLTAKAAGTGLRVAGQAAAPILGMTTGAGREAVEQAYQAGRAGGPTAVQFAENLRNQAPMTNVLDIAKQNLEQFKIDRGNVYRANISNIKGDTTVLKFDGIDKALQNAQDKVTFKGQVKNAEAAQNLSEVRQMIDDWKNLNPAEFHTPEGLDALKQQVGQVLERTKPGTQADMVVKNVYNSIKSEISKQAPTYSKTMQAYSEATDQIREIERALSLGDKASSDTAMRKLQSLMRNNAATNYGQRLNLARQLEEQGGQQMLPALAGQAMSELTPRGIQRATAPLGVGGLFYAGGAVPAVLGTAASSPRIVGEAAFGTGQLTRGLLGVGGMLPEANYPAILNLLYQSEQMKEQ